MVRTYCKIPRCMKWANLTADGICPRHDTLDKKDKGDVVYNCLDCDQVCTEQQKALLCERCNKWIHTSCADISDTFYDAFFEAGSKLSCFHFYCKTCDGKVEEALQKYATLENDTKELKVEMTTVKDQLASIHKTIRTSIRTNISTAIDDKNELDKRKMNLIVFGLPEVESSDGTWGISEKVKKDIETMNTIISDELNVALSPRTGIIEARRLGAKVQNKHRPLRIEFRDIGTKRDVLTKAKNLRNSTNTVAKQLYINPDLTKEQKEADKKLRAEMWRQREEENKNVIIRRGKIVTSEVEVRKSRNSS